MSALFLHGFGGTAHCADALGLKGLLIFGHHCRWRETRVRTFDDEVSRLSAQVPANTTLVGYSMGARLALAVALRTTRVTRLVLLSGRAGINEHERPARMSWEDAVAAQLTGEGIEAFAETWEALPLFATRRAADGYPEQQKRRRQHDPDGLAAAITTLGTGRMPDLRDQLPRLQAPTDLVAGAMDPRYVAIAHDMQRSIPNARAHIVDNAGHDLVLEAPERVRAIACAPTSQRTAV